MKLYNQIAWTLIALISTTNTFAGTMKTGHYSGVYGVRSYKVYLPETSSAQKMPVIIMLHGCDQNADEFSISSHILEAADKNKFAVLLPEQTLAQNPFKCWNWIIPGNNSRFGEPEVVIEMLDDVVSKYNIDNSRVFAAGMSAGASMAGILGNCFPERVKAVASHDGVQFYPTYYGGDFATVVLNGATVPAEQAGGIGYACSSMYHPPKQMPIIIFQGMASPLMNPLHAFQIEDEFKILNDYLDNGVRDFSAFKDKKIENFPESKTYGYTKYSIADKAGSVYIETYMINQLNHAWSGGDGKYKYNDPKGPDATQLMINFFKRFGL